MLKRIFNFGKSKNRGMEKVIKSVPKLEMDTKVEKPIELTNRTIYPVIQISLIKNEDQDFAVVEAFPIALVVKEPSDEYVISLTDDEIHPEKFKEMVFPERPGNVQ